MALNTVYDLIQKKGEDYVREIFESDVVITEKLDTYRFLFEKEGDYIRFYKKNNSEINLVERTLTDAWEDAIQDIPVRMADKKIPENLTFGVAYTPVDRPIRLPYEALPKYVLTDITERKNGKVVKAYDYDKVEEWANYLNMGVPPIIFEGKMSEKQRESLLKYGKLEYDDFDEDEFVKIVENLFESTYSQSQMIEGIIVQGKDNQLIKINSYEFDILNEAYQKTHHSKDFYDLVILSINKLMENYSIPLLEEKSINERYIDIICDIFNKYCEEYTINEEHFIVDYLTPPTYGYLGNLNKNFITNEKTLENIEKGPLYEAIFRVILSAFRKKKKPHGLLNESSVEKFNSYVYLLNSIAREEYNNINEQEKFEDEENINETRSDNKTVEEIGRKQHSDIDNMRIISSIQKAFDVKSLEKNKGRQECAIYITDCRPFTNQNLENVKKIYNEWNIPVIVGTISNNKMIQGDKFYFSDQLKISQLNSLNQFYPKIITKYIFLETWNLAEIFELCRPEFEPKVLITDEKKKSDFALQLYFEEEVMGKRINVDEEFNVGEMNTEDTIQAFRAIEDSDAYEFKENTPQAIQNLFNNMVTEYKTWSGQLLK